MNSERLLPELLRLDAAGDPAGAAAALVAARLDPADAAFAVYRLVMEGRFRAAHESAKLLTDTVPHPVLAVARALGDAMFEDAEAPAAAAGAVRAIAAFADPQRFLFEDQLLVPAFQQAMAAEFVARDPALEARVHGLFAALSTRFAARAGAAALPGIEFPDPIAIALSPFWRGTEQHETLTFLRLNPHAPAQARPLFRPEHIRHLVSVTRDVLYEPGRDYTLDAATGTLALTPESRIPFKTLTELAALAAHRLPFPRDDPRALHFRQTEVAYTHASGLWRGPVPERAEANLPRTLGLLRVGAPVDLLVLGDSIAEAAGASAAMKLAPGLPSFVEQVARGLERASGSRINVENLAKGGWSSDAGARLAIGEKLGARRPDLVIVAFGMNDITFVNSGYGGVYDAANYGLRIAAIIEAIRKDMREAEFILVSPMFGNAESPLFPPAQFLAFRDQLARLIGKGIALADVTGMLAEMLKTKSWIDTSMNGVNHPNDYMHRVYAQVILALLVG